MIVKFRKPNDLDELNTRLEIATIAINGRLSAEEKDKLVDDMLSKLASMSNVRLTPEVPDYEAPD